MVTEPSLVAKSGGVNEQPADISAAELPALRCELSVSMAGGMVEGLGMTKGLLRMFVWLVISGMGCLEAGHGVSWNKFGGQVKECYLKATQGNG